MSTVETTARHVELSADEYHAHPAIGSTMLETFRKSRRTYYGMHVAQELPGFESTEEMNLGTLVHWRLLEPRKLTTHVNAFPELARDGDEWNWRKPDHREQRDSIYARAKERNLLCVERSVLNKVEEISEGVESNKTASKILSQPGEAEFSIFWTDIETGLECKCRLDWFAAMCLDIKTTCDPAPEPYAKQCHRLGYHRKFAHYRAGLRAHCGEKRDFVHLAIGTSKPYTVGQYNLMDQDRNGMSLGQCQRRRMLHDLAQCLKTGDWREPYEKGIVDLELPGYAHAEDAYAL
jgi:hypothetical protein